MTEPESSSSFIILTPLSAYTEIGVIKQYINSVVIGILRHNAGNKFRDNGRIGLQTAAVLNKNVYAYTLKILKPCLNIGTHALRRLPRKTKKQTAFVKMLGYIGRLLPANALFEYLLTEINIKCLYSGFDFKPGAYPPNALRQAGISSLYR